MQIPCMERLMCIFTLCAIKSILAYSDPTMVFKVCVMSKDWFTVSNPSDFFMAEQGFEAMSSES